MRGETEESATHLYVVRHAESEGNAAGFFGGHTGIGLTALGAQQAAYCAAHLHGELGGSLAAVVSSDLPRAAQTAGPIAAAFGLTPVLTPAFRERSVGVLDGLAFDDARVRYPAEFEKILSRDLNAPAPEGGESHAMVGERVGQGVDELLVKYAGQRVVVVSHALAIFHLLRRVLNLPIDPGGQRVFLYKSNCGITHLEYSSKGIWKVRYINRTGHLKELESRFGFEHLRGA